MYEHALGRVAIATVCGAAMTANADIIHTDIEDVVLVGASWTDEETYFVDFNHDGADEVLLTAWFDTAGGSGGPEAQAYGLDHSHLLHSLTTNVAYMAFADELIGPANSDQEYTTATSIDKDWLDLPPDQGAYLGVRFALGDQNHYGWIRLSTYIDEPNDYAMVMTVFEFAYETRADTPIPAGAVPAPGGLAALAVGAAAMLRRQRPAGR
ncbi:MAG: hypothetical protein AMXMBFR58_36140 [Phycisphaerae bacterium]|nr:hypothetical protein [Phycisphaerales bacterium]